MPFEGATASFATALLVPPEDFSAAVSERPEVWSGLAAFCCAHNDDARRTLRPAATHQLRICSSYEAFWNLVGFVFSVLDGPHSWPTPLDTSSFPTVNSYTTILLDTSPAVRGEKSQELTG